MITHTRSIIIAAVILLSTQVGFGFILTTEEKLADFHQLVSMTKSGYGPYQYKIQEQNIDVDALVNRYENLVKATQTNKDFYYLMVKFVAEFKDSHFSLSVPSRRVAYVPFTVDYVEGKAVVDETMQLPSTIKRGDEIVTFNGRPVTGLLNELEQYIHAGSPLTRRRKAAMAMTMRFGNQMPLPSGSVEVEVLSRKTQKRVVAHLQWYQIGSALDEEVTVVQPRLAHAGNPYGMLSIKDYWEQSTHPMAEMSFRCSGKTRVEVPKNATMISEKPFVAYFYPTPKGNVGYLRIPHYIPMDDQGEYLFEERFAQYQYAVKVLEENTVALVIDQDHNCGGSVTYLEDIVSLFIEQQVPTLQFTLRANKQEVLKAIRWSGEVPANTLDYQNIMKVLNLLKTAWEKGDFMTGSTSITGQEFIYPNSEVRYTKPIVMLIDEMSGSGGDAFPAIMQGIGRAKLMGTRTMGAGGHVLPQPPLSYSMLQANMTKSLFYRPSGIAIENNGAEPDIPYTITVKDFNNGYKDYRRTYTQEVLKLVK